MGALGYSTDAASVFGAVFITGGVTGSIVLGIALEKSKLYKITTIFVCLFSLLVTGVLYFVIKN